MLNNEFIENGNIEELGMEALEEISGGKDAGQKIKATGNANIRKGPGLEYETRGSVSAGTKLPFLGFIKEDKRGVKWYKVTFNGKPGWISSRYSKIV